MCRVHACSQDARVCMHRCSQCAGVCGGSTEQEGGKQIWLADSGVWCAALVTLASAMTPSEHGSESLIGCEGMHWYYISHQGKLECWVESCFRMNCLLQIRSIVSSPKVKCKNTGISMVRSSNLVFDRRQPLIWITYVVYIRHAFMKLVYQKMILFWSLNTMPPDWLHQLRAVFSLLCLSDSETMWMTSHIPTE